MGHNVSLLWNGREISARSMKLPQKELVEIRAMTERVYCILCENFVETVEQNQYIPMIYSMEYVVWYVVGCVFV